MPQDHIYLLQIFKSLVRCIKGDWFMTDGALLGMMREGKLIEWDHDIDICLLPDATVDELLLDQHKLLYQDYYMCGKVYDKVHPKIKLNPWKEYIDYIRCLPHNYGMNRCELMKEAKKTYLIDHKPALFTKNHIDVFKLEQEVADDSFYLPYLNIFSESNIVIRYQKDMIYPLKKAVFQGININIPNKPEEVLKVLYGSNWQIPDQDYYRCSVN